MSTREQPGVSGPDPAVVRDLMQKMHRAAYCGTPQELQALEDQAAGLYGARIFRHGAAGLVTPRELCGLMQRTLLSVPGSGRNQQPEED